MTPRDVKRILEEKIANAENDLKGSTDACYFSQLKGQIDAYNDALSLLETVDPGGDSLYRGKWMAALMKVYRISSLRTFQRLTPVGTIRLVQAERKLRSGRTVSIEVPLGESDLQREDEGTEDIFRRLARELDLSARK